MSSRKRKQVPTSSTDICTSFEDLLQRVDECLRRQSATVSALLLPSFEGVDVLATVVCNFVFSNPFTDPIPCWIPHFKRVATLKASAKQLGGTRIGGMPLRCFEDGNLLELECQISGSDLPHEWLRKYPFGDLRVDLAWDKFSCEMCSGACKLQCEAAPTRRELKRWYQLYQENEDVKGSVIYTQVLMRWEKRYDFPRCAGALNLHLGLRFDSKALGTVDSERYPSTYEKLDIERNAAALDCNKGKSFAGEYSAKLGGFIRAENREKHFVDCKQCGGEVVAELLYNHPLDDYIYNLVYCPLHPLESFCHNIEI